MTAPDPPSFTCPCCGAVSREPNDVEQRYCGRCHDWTGDPGLGALHLARHCPRRTRGRTLAEIPDAAVRAAIAEHARLLYDRPEPTVLSDEALFRRVLEAALPHLPTVRQDLHAHPWRQGRHEPRHLYAQTGPEPSDEDPIVGTLDTAEAAEEACTAHNERLAQEERS